MIENFDEQTHKLQLWIPDALFLELGEYFPHGMRKPVFQKLAEDILEMMKKTGNPEMVCNAILAKELRLGKEFRATKRD